MRNIKKARPAIHFVMKETGPSQVMSRHVITQAFMSDMMISNMVLQENSTSRLTSFNTGKRIGDKSSYGVVNEGFREPDHLRYVTKTDASMTGLDMQVQCLEQVRPLLDVHLRRVEMQQQHARSRWIHKLPVVQVQNQSSAALPGKRPRHFLHDFLEQRARHK